LSYEKFKEQFVVKKPLRQASAENVGIPKSQDGPTFIAKKNFESSR